MLVTLKIKDKESLSCVFINDLSYKIDEINKNIIIYNKDNLLGVLEYVYGIDEDSFVKDIKEYEK